MNSEANIATLCEAREDASQHSSQEFNESANSVENLAYHASAEITDDGDDVLGLEREPVLYETRGNGLTNEGEEVEVLEPSGNPDSIHSSESEIVSTPSVHDESNTESELGSVDGEEEEEEVKQSDSTICAVQSPFSTDSYEGAHSESDDESNINSTTSASDDSSIKSTALADANLLTKSTVVTDGNISTNSTASTDEDSECDDNENSSQVGSNRRLSVSDTVPDTGDATGSSGDENSFPSENLSETDEECGNVNDSLSPIAGGTDSPIFLSEVDPPPPPPIDPLVRRSPVEVLDYPHETMNNETGLKMPVRLPPAVPPSVPCRESPSSKFETSEQPRELTGRPSDLIPIGTAINEVFMDYTSSDFYVNAQIMKSFPESMVSSIQERGHGGPSQDVPLNSVRPRDSFVEKETVGDALDGVSQIGDLRSSTSSLNTVQHRKNHAGNLTLVEVHDEVSNEPYETARPRSTSRRSTYLSQDSLQSSSMASTDFLPGISVFKTSTQGRQIGFSMGNDPREEEEEKLQSIIESLQHENAVLKSQVDIKSKHLDQAETEKVDMKTLWEESKRTLEADIDRLQENKQTLKLALQSEISKADEMSKEHRKELQRKQEEFEERQIAYVSTITNLESIVARLQNEKSGIEVQLKELSLRKEAQIDRLQATMEDLKLENSKSKMHLQQLNSEHNALTHKYRMVKEREGFNNLVSGGQHQPNTPIPEDLLNELETLRHVANKRAISVDEWKNKVMQLEQENQDASALIDKQKEMIEDLERALRTSQENMRELSLQKKRLLRDKSFILAGEHPALAEEAELSLSVASERSDDNHAKQPPHQRREPENLSVMQQEIQMIARELANVKQRLGSQQPAEQQAAKVENSPASIGIRMEQHGRQAAGGVAYGTRPVEGARGQHVPSASHGLHDIRKKFAEAQARANSGERVHTGVGHPQLTSGFPRPQPDDQVADSLVRMQKGAPPSTLATPVAGKRVPREPNGIKSVFMPDGPQSGLLARNAEQLVALQEDKRRREAAAPFATQASMQDRQEIAQMENHLMQLNMERERVYSSINHLRERGMKTMESRRELASLETRLQDLEKQAGRLRLQLRTQ